MKYLRWLYLLPSLCSLGCSTDDTSTQRPWEVGEEAGEGEPAEQQMGEDEGPSVPAPPTALIELEGIIEGLADVPVYYNDGPPSPKRLSPDESRSQGTLITVDSLLGHSEYMRHYRRCHFGGFDIDDIDDTDDTEVPHPLRFWDDEIILSDDWREQFGEENISRMSALVREPTKVTTYITLLVYARVRGYWVSDDDGGERFRIVEAEADRAMTALVTAGCVYPLPGDRLTFVTDRSAPFGHRVIEDVSFDVGLVLDNELEPGHGLEPPYDHPPLHSSATLTLSLFGSRAPALVIHGVGPGAYRLFERISSLFENYIRGSLSSCESRLCLDFDVQTLDWPAEALPEGTTHVEFNPRHWYIGGYTHDGLAALQLQLILTDPEDEGAHVHIWGFNELPDFDPDAPPL